MAILLCVIAMMLLPTPGFADDAAENDAPDLTGFCSYSFGASDYAHVPDALSDWDFQTERFLWEGKTIGISWDDTVLVDSVFIEFSSTPTAYRIVQRNAQGEPITQA